MVVLGLVLVLLALLLGAALITGTSAPETVGQDVDVHVLDAVTFTLNPLTLVISGMVVMFLLWLGLVLIKTTLARKARLRRERKAAELEARDRHRREEAEAAERARHEEGERQLEERRLREERRLGEERRAGGSTALPPKESTATSSTDETRPLPREGAGGSTRPFTRGPGGPGENQR
ncbi:hypothetical protein O9K63_09245 [Janibacter cremeus]|uniref:hypothetical protein n=1 Tax=Janibacter cremeus TaxID=1285192 RepID=UPI0023F624E9|nr:hypothetical protein [Janibacter cremeus]WEV76790.1 hypothetical protein O9K63_09245 [Janibacter cremeus]